MKNSKLIKLLKLFDTQEIKQLRKFVQKMSSDEALPKLFKFLTEQSPKFEYEKEQCFLAVHPEKSYSDVILRKLFANGIKIVEKFIQLIELEQSDLVKNRLLTSFYERKEATELWEKQIKSWQKANQKSEWNLHFQENLLMAQQQYRYRTTLKDKVFSVKNKRNQVTAMKDLMVALELLIIRYVFSIKNTSLYIFNLTFYKKELNFPVFEKTINSLNRLDKEVINSYQRAHPGIGVAWKTHQLNTDLDRSHFVDLKQLLFNDTSIPKQNQIGLTNNLIYYCLDLHKREKRGDLKEIFSIYKWSLERRLFHKNNYLTSAAYYSICNSALLLKELDWADWFLNTYTKDLPKAEQFDCFNCCKATYCFVKKDFKGVIKHSQKLEKANSYPYSFDLKLQVLMSYYELEDDQFETAFNGFRVMLSRNSKVRVDRVNNYKLFLNYLYQLHNAPKGSTEKLLPLKQKILNTDKKIPVKWLLGKIEEKLGK